MATTHNGYQSLLTVREAASVLRESVTSTRCRIKNGTLTAVRLGDTPSAPLRIPAAELDRFLAVLAGRSGKD